MVVLKALGLIIILAFFTLAVFVGLVCAVCILGGFTNEKFDKEEKK